MKEIKEILFRRDNWSVALLFLLFFPLKTLVYNSVYLVFDVIFTSGKISNIYTFNYTGSLLGCLEILKAQESLGAKADSYYTIVFNFLFLMSFLCGLLLIRRIKKSNDINLINLLLLVVFSFALYETLIYFTTVIPYLTSFNSLFDSTARWVTFLEYTLISFMATYLFFKLFSKTVKLLIIFVVLPASILSSMYWFGFLGPYLMPIQTL